MKRFSKRARWCCCSGCAVVLLVPLILVGLLITPPPRPRPLSPTERAEAVRKAEAVREQVKTLAKDVTAGRRRDFQMQIGEAEVNELLQNDADIRQMVQQLRLQDPYVVIDEGVVRLTATRNVGGADVASTLSVNPRLDSDGRISVTVESAQVGRLRLPDNVTQRFAERLARELTLKVNEGKVRLRSVRVQPGQILVEGSTR